MRSSLGLTLKCLRTLCGFRSSLSNICVRVAESCIARSRHGCHRHRLLLIRCMSALNREQELSGPQVMSYLMGWGDSYKSHNYTPVNWWSLKKALARKFPYLTMRERSVISYSYRDETHADCRSGRHQGADNNGAVDISEEEETSRQVSSHRTS